MKRIFAAIKIKPEEKFVQTVYHLKSELKNENIKWVDLENLHITLKFFGETHESQIPEIDATLDDLAAKWDSLSFTIKGLGIFGSSYKPRVIWAGIEDDGNLKELGEAILNELDNQGFERDRQNFVPHLTLARIKFVENKKRLKEVISDMKEMNLQMCVAENILLMESILKPNGPEYTILSKYPLK